MKGFKLVPVEPTDEMLQAAYEEMGSPSCCTFDAVAYREMLAAAPTPPQPIYDEAADRELFEQVISKRGWSAEKVDGFYSEPHVHFAWSICLELAQSRAKAGEVGHE